MKGKNDDNCGQGAKGTEPVVFSGGSPISPGFPPPSFPIPMGWLALFCTLPTYKEINQ